MKLIRQPEDFSPAFQEILYTVALEEGKKGAEVSIFNSPVTEKIGIKQVGESLEFTLNVADYVRSQIRLEPVSFRESGIIHTPERAYNSCIAYDTWACRVPHIAGKVAVTTNRLLSGRLNRTLGEDEQDEVSWIAEEGPVSARAIFQGKNGSLEIYLGRREVKEREMVTLILNGSHLGKLLAQQERKWADFSTMSVLIHHDFQPVGELSCRLDDPNEGKTRLCWWNRYGGIDYHTFESPPETVMIRAKEAISAGNGTVVLPSKSHKKIKAATAYTTEKQAEELAELLSSPQVWLVQEAHFIPVTITGDRLITRNDRITELIVECVCDAEILESGML